MQLPSSHRTSSNLSSFLCTYLSALLPSLLLFPTDQAPEKRPRKEVKEDRNDDNAMGLKKPASKAGASSSRASSNSGSVAASGKGTYPKPKNFAERMMNALETKADPEVISWLADSDGGDNKDDADLISINTKVLKDSEILETNFQGIRYAAFVRNLSRW